MLQSIHAHRRGLEPGKARASREKGDGTCDRQDVSFWKLLSFVASTDEMLKEHLGWMMVWQASGVPLGTVKQQWAVLYLRMLASQW